MHTHHSTCHIASTTFHTSYVYAWYCINACPVVMQMHVTQTQTIHGMALHHSAQHAYHGTYISHYDNVSRLYKL